MCWVFTEALGKNAVVSPNVNPFIVSFIALNPNGDNLGDKAPSSTCDVTSTLQYWEIFG